MIDIVGHDEIYVLCDAGGPGAVDIVNTTTDLVTSRFYIAGALFWGGVYVPSVGRVYIDDYRNGLLLAYDLGGTTPVAKISMPGLNAPELPVLDPRNGLIYLTSTPNGNVGIVDPVSDTFVENISLGAGIAAHPSEITYDAGLGDLWVPLYWGSTLDLLDGNPPIIPISFHVLPPRYSVYFNETGLPPAFNWSVTLNGATIGSNNTTVVFSEANGTYTYAIGSVPGYRSMPPSGTVPVNGAATGVGIGFSPVGPTEFTASFIESGLAAGTTWAVTLAAATHSSSTAWVNFTLPVGAYGFSIWGVPGYRVAAWGGTIQVLDRNVSLQVVWSQVTYAVWFNESGLPGGTAWELHLQEGTVYLNTTFTVSSVLYPLANSTYEFSVAGPASYSVVPPNGQVTVAGAARTVAITFAIRNGYVVGSVVPSSASLTIDTVVAPTSAGQFNLTEKPGVYSVEASKSGYLTFFTNITVSAGNATWLNVTLPVLPSIDGVSPAGAQSDVLPELVAAAVAVVAVVAALLLYLRRRNAATPTTETDDPKQSELSPEPSAAEERAESAPEDPAFGYTEDHR